MNSHQSILKNAAKQPSKLGALPPNPRFGGNIELAPRSLTFCFLTTTPTRIPNFFLLNLTNTTGVEPFFELFERRDVRERP